MMLSLDRLDQEWQDTYTCMASPEKCTCLWEKKQSLELFFIF